jgi:hypothetical protein
MWTNESQATKDWLTIPVTDLILCLKYNSVKDRNTDDVWWFKLLCCIRVTWSTWSSGLSHHAVQKEPNVSEEHTTSSFNHRVSQETELSKQHGITNQNTILFIVTSLRSSNLSSCNIKQAQNNEICNNSYMTVVQLPHSTFCIHSVSALGEPPAKGGKTVLLLKLLFSTHRAASCLWWFLRMLPYAICQFPATCHHSSVHIQYRM